jgi:hypothetical protein
LNHADPACPTLAGVSRSTFPDRAADPLRVNPVVLLKLLNVICAGKCAATAITKIAHNTFARNAEPTSAHFIFLFPP